MSMSHIMMSSYVWCLSFCGCNEVIVWLRWFKLLYVFFRFLMFELFLVFFFFFQAEDGIRDKLVTGVQTCALPICRERHDRVDGRGHPDPVQPPAGASDTIRAGPLRPAEPLGARAQALHQLAAAEQIGRASCRERV